MALDANELDDMTCTAPGCGCGGALYVHSRCHPNAPTWARYMRGSAVLELMCCECATVITSVALTVSGPANRAARRRARKELG